jgi:hypothetical protein
VGGAVADAGARAQAPGHSTTARRDRPGAASQSLWDMKVATDSSAAVVRQPIARLGSGVPFHRQRIPTFALPLDALRYQLKQRPSSAGGGDIRVFVSEVARINRMTAPGSRTNRSQPNMSVHWGEAVKGARNDAIDPNRTLLFSLPHSIISSARARSDHGTLRPSTLAVFMLMTSSAFVGNSTDRSPGAAPFKILSTYADARCKFLRKSIP